MKIQHKLEELQEREKQISDEIKKVLNSLKGTSIVYVENKEEQAKKIKRELGNVKKRIEKGKRKLNTIKKEKNLNRILGKGKILLVIYKFVILPLTILFIAMRILGKEEIVHSVFGIIPAILRLSGIQEINEEMLKIILLVEAYLTDLLIVMVFYVPTLYLFRKFRVPIFYKALAVLMWLIPVLFIFSIAWNLNN